ncbi:hypothetical protein BJV77DRAFT_964859 [Russula vinacea]|nr:hypothetical protein BJV77DRAFT_964859 [Russula vinacea]
MATWYSFQTQPPAKVCLSSVILSLPFRRSTLLQETSPWCFYDHEREHPPVALLQSLAVSVPGLEWGKDDTVDSIVGRALTYLLLCGTVGQFIRWSYGVYLLSKACEVEHPVTLDDETGPFVEDTEYIEYVRREDTPRVPTVPQFSDPEAIFSSSVSSEDEDLPVPAWSRRNTFPQRVAGNCSIPLTLVVLGAYFHTPADKYKLPPLDDDLGSQRATPLSQLRKFLCFESESRMGALRLQTHAPQLGNNGEGSTIFAIILARMFIVPLLFLPLVVFGALRGSPGVFKESQEPPAMRSND